MNQRYENFAVVRNHLDRFAIWPLEKLDHLPSQWHPVGYQGSQEEVREYLREHWPEVRDWSDDELDDELDEDW